MDNTYTLTSLVNKTISGDNEAFEKLISSKKDIISYQIRRNKDCRDEAEDISQKVVIQVFQRISSLKYPAAFNSWLSTIVERECIRHIKSKDQLISIEDHPGIDGLIRETDKDFIPDANVELLEQSKEIKTALKKLPEKSRDMLVLYYNDGMCYKDIAEQMGVSVGTVSANLFRAKKRLRKEIRLS